MLTSPLCSETVHRKMPWHMAFKSGDICPCAQSLNLIAILPEEVRKRQGQYIYMVLSIHGPYRLCYIRSDPSSTLPCTISVDTLRCRASFGDVPLMYRHRHRYRDTRGSDCIGPHPSARLTHLPPPCILEHLLSIGSQLTSDACPRFLRHKLWALRTCIHDIWHGFPVS